EWGDHVTLQAAADKFAAKICLLTSFRDTCFVEIVPQYQAPQRGNILASAKEQANIVHIYIKRH
uniref:Uncharacterized protein n=1 Tax=Aegilops tauschii subsp. strangulata TaxID=200361 RepID=A0A453BWQ7_AEGTS